MHGIYPLSKRLRVQYVSDCSLVSSSLFQTHGTRPQCGRHPRPAALLVFSVSPQLGTCGFRNAHRALHSAQAPRGDLCSHSFLHFCTLKPEKHCDSERGRGLVRAHPRRAAPSPPTRPQPHPRLPLCGPRRAAAPSSSPVGLSYTDGQELAARHSGHLLKPSFPARCFCSQPKLKECWALTSHVSLPCPQPLLDGVCLPAGDQALLMCLSLVIAALGRAG